MARRATDKAQSELESGCRVGADFRLETRLGEGPSGQTWLARRVSDGSHVAIKIAHPSVAKDPALRARFAQEAKLAQEIESEHVVQSAGFGVSDGGAPYLVLEYLEGETLQKRFDRGDAFEPGWVLDLADQVASALEAAHAVNVVHRDLKPENIFLLVGDAPRVKVLDFGLAEPGTDEAPPSPFTAPEQLRGAPHDEGADVWALSVIVYRALSGALPFAGPAMRERASTGDHPAIRSLAPDLPPALDGFFARAFAPDPDDRFGSPRQSYEALAAALIKPPRRRRNWTDDLLLFAVVAAGTALGALAASASWP